MDDPAWGEDESGTAAFNRRVQSFSEKLAKDFKKHSTNINKKEIRKELEEQVKSISEFLGKK